MGIPSHLCFQQCLEAAAAWRIFIYPPARLLWCSARRAPLLPPPECLVLHMLGTGIPNMCITSREHQSYCVAELLHIPGSVSTLPWPAQSKCLHNLNFKPKQGWLKSWGGCCHCPKSLGKGVLGTLLLDPPPWGAAQSPSAGHFTPSAGHLAPSLFCFTVRGEKKNAARKEEKKNRLRSRGHINKRLT